MALVPLAHAIVRCASTSPRFPARALFLRGLLTGVTFFAGTVYWTADVMAVYGGLPVWQAAPVASLLIAYLAIYPAVATVAAGWLVRQYGAPALAAFPLCWVASEYLRGTLFTGFPWVLLGYSQASVLPVAQLVSVGGVYLLSLLVASTSAAVTYALAPRRKRHVALAVVCLSLMATAAWGTWRMNRESLLSAGTPVTVGLVQGNVSQDQKWDPARRAEILSRYLELTESAAEQGASLVVWPESSTPFIYAEDRVGREAVQAAVRRTGVHLLLGSDEIEWRSPTEYYNSALLLNPAADTVASYRKVHLVPFGEYVPLRRLLFFVAPLVESVGDFSAGATLAPLPFGPGAIAVAICYEAVFPAQIAASVRQGAALISTLTNDAWYGTSSAPYQHFEQASLRAIEQGRYLVRAANTGISAIVDPYGRVGARSALFETSVVVGQVRMLSGSTLYAKMGDAVPVACLIGAVLALVGSRRRRP